MNARQRGGFTETGNDLDAEGPLRRWARRKREVAREKKAEDEAWPRGDSPDPSDAAHGGGASTVDAPEPAVAEEEVLTDADMPSLDSLDEDSDYSGFLSSGVSEELRRRALRKLFSSAVFNIPDGLDDYDDDFTTFAALGDIVTADMRHQQEMEAERARQARAESEAAATSEDESGEAEGRQPAHADDREELPADVESADRPDSSDSPVPVDSGAPVIAGNEVARARAQAAEEPIPAAAGAPESDSGGGGSAAGVAFEDRRAAPPHDGEADEEGVSTGCAPSEDGSSTSVTNARASGGAEMTTGAGDTDHGRA